MIGGCNVLEKIKKVLPDVLIVVGAVSISSGAFLIYKPAGFICWGVMCIGGAILLIKGGDED